MGSSPKSRQTMLKMTRERRLRERRAQKQEKKDEKKDEKKQAAAAARSEEAANADGSNAV